MNDLLSPLLGGLSLLGSLTIWALVIFGLLFGAVIGAMPGMGITLAFGLALPFTFVMEPVQAVAFLLAISVGGQWGNSIPAILLGVPGSPASALTAIDGFKLHKQGKSGLALGTMHVSAIGGQLVSIPFFVFAVVPLSGLAYVFLAPELFALYTLGMVALASITGKSILKGFIAVGLGIMVGMVGVDPMNNTPRLVFGVFELRGGVPVVPAVVGLLALSELFRSSRQVFPWSSLTESFSAKFPSTRQLRGTSKAMSIGTVSGTVVGAIPGASGTAAAVISYQQAQLFSKKPEEFGEGSVEAVAANEASQNASNAGELIPTLGFGIPGSGSMVLLLSALTLQGLIPGPLLIRESPELLDAAVAGLVAGSLVLIAIGWYLAKGMLKVTTLDRSTVLSVAIMTVLVGIYSVGSDTFNVVVCLVFGVIGYFMLRYGYSTPAAALALILADGFERSLRQGLGLFGNSFVEFLSRPITATILLIALSILILNMVQKARMATRLRGADSLESKDSEFPSSDPRA